ncbi:MAG: alpha/beta hydrolase [Flavisolibacter sp.]|nr:alpha/beta hydrolase [Flavisolibacter sp.]
MDVKTLQLSNGITLEYAEQGGPSGTVLICLHGYADSWRSFEPLFNYLPPTIHVFAVSQRGHGRSDRPLEGYTPSDFAADIALFIDGLNLGAAIIVGHSMGATIAQRFALDFPQKTKALILIGAIASFPINKTMAELEVAVAALNDPVDSSFAEEFQKSTLVRPVHPLFFQTVMHENLLLPARVWKAILAPLMSVDYTKELHTLNKQVLLVRGSEDSFATTWDQDRLLESITGAQLVVYDGTGHAVHWEEPQRFAREVEDFVYKVVQGGPVHP